MGPDDFAGAPANGLVRSMTKRWFRISAPIGFSVLDVRDYAEGVLRAAEVSRHGRRYILGGDNLMVDQLLEQVAVVTGRPRPRWLVPIFAWMVYPIITAIDFWSRLRRKPPLVTRSLLEIWSRYAWYYTSFAREDLGWRPRPLSDTPKDTLDWSLPTS
jgi:dihydroflavonol-4-reductase